MNVCRWRGSRGFNMRLMAALGIGLTALEAAAGQGMDFRTCEVDAEAGTCKELESVSRAAGQKVDITCKALAGNQIDWNCVFGPGALEEVSERGGFLTTCPSASKVQPCSRFIVEKDEERSEVKVKSGPNGFDFRKGDRYIFKYSFRAKEGMRVASSFTHLGQLKGSKGGYFIFGVPIYSLTANNDGLMVRFSNLESIKNFIPGMQKHLSWEDATGQWVHVEIDTVFGESMEVEISGAVKGKAVWPKNEKPVAWHSNAEMVRMKLGLYHSINDVYDGEVEYRDISIEGPNGIIRTSSAGRVGAGDPDGSVLVGCFKDKKESRVMKAKYTSKTMTAEKCADYCSGDEFYGMQLGTECWCGDASTKVDKHGKGTCNIPCAGAPLETCGGELALSVYKYGGYPAEIAKGTTYLGCYADKTADRALTLKFTSNASKMDYETCAKLCSDEKASVYFGVEYGQECFCGSSQDKFAKHGPASCSMACPGDSGQLCGGPNALNVFKL